MASCHTTAAPRPARKPALTVALAGNPNCGKSALFNAFTGIRQKTGNWPGVTVERKEGRFELEGRPVAVVDLPGIYSLDASSLDEQVTRNYLLSREADLVVNVVDAGNLERNLYLTVQLLEMGVPVVLALNMMDVAEAREYRIDVDALANKRSLNVCLLGVLSTYLEIPETDWLAAVRANLPAKLHEANEQAFALGRAAGET